MTTRDVFSTYLKSGAERFCVGQSVYFYRLGDEGPVVQSGLFISGGSAFVCLSLSGSIEFIPTEACFLDEDDAHKFGLIEFRCRHGVYQ